MVEQADFVELQITSEMRSMAQWLAERRILYEYPGHDPAAFGEYDEGHIPVIQMGIIGELAVFEHFHNALVQNFGELAPMERWRAVEGKLTLQTRLGSFDEGYDLNLSEQTLDVKTYVDQILTPSQVRRVNLFVNVNEVRRRGAAGLYVQTFPIEGDRIILAGYHEGLPAQIRRNIPSPAYACPVPDLQPIADLTNRLLQ